MKLYGEILKRPYLRFDYSSTYAVKKYSKDGLLRHGPYDSSQFGKEKIRCGIVYSQGLDKGKERLITGLVSGEGNFGGFQSFFRVPLIFEEEREFGNNAERVFKDIASRDLDIVFVLFSEKENNLYKSLKEIFLGNGMPCQVVLVEKLHQQGLQWILENICLATYAKIGGTPWVVANPMQSNQLVLGISRTQDKNKNYFVGFVTLFTQDGDFVLMYSSAPVIRWEEYVKGLTKLIEESIEEYKRLKGIPDQIILHLHKRPGFKELEAIENALKHIGKGIPYALLHLNEYSNFRLFDTGHQTYVPEMGFTVNLSTREAILLIDGRIGNQRRRMGVPRVLDITMDIQSTISKQYFPKLVKQVYDFSFINWRGFNARAIPVTINYSKLIARMIIEVGVNSWNQIIASGKLRDKAWFL